MEFGLFMAILYTLRLFVIYFDVIWYIFPRFGILYQEQSGNPDHKSGKIFTAAKKNLETRNSEFFRFICKRRTLS
jgi:hypothetical protein